MEYLVRAGVRARGAIGVHYPQDFTLYDIPENYTKEQIKDEWFKCFGNYWELFSFSKIEPVNRAV